MPDIEDVYLNISGITYDSIVDGPGLRCAIFVQGCPHRCPGCHNPQTQPFEGGERVDIVSVLEEIGEDPLLTGVTFSGGEPFSQAAALASLGKMVKDAGYDLMTYTGFVYEELLLMAENDPGVRELLELTDILVDGPFIMEERDLELLYRGSRNQRLIDLAAMRKAGDMNAVINWYEPGIEVRL